MVAFESGSEDQFKVSSKKTFSNLKLLKQKILKL